MVSGKATSSKEPTMIRANVISRLLGKTFTKSETYGSRIRGVHMWTRGYHVETDYNDTVWVSFRGCRNGKDHSDMLNAYAEKLASAGYTVQMYERSIKITGKE